MKNLLVIKKLKKKFLKKEIIKDISFNVHEGSVFAFLGPNGAGKSTTMNILSTLLEKSSGEIILDGHNLSDRSTINKRNIGYVFQDNTLDEELSVYENLYLRGSLYDLKKTELISRITHISKELKINSFLYQKYGKCSGGQKRLVMIAKSLLYSPKLLILDEPTVGLDPHIRKLVWEILVKMNHQTNLTILFSTHYMEEAMLADHICIVNQGKVIVNLEKNNFFKKFDHKKLRVEEKKREYTVDLQTAEQALSILSKIDKEKLESFHFDNYSLDDIFIQLIETSEKRI